jgi:undecaprenyl diphosphate synthase
MYNGLYHVGIIPDGNRRWALEHGLDPTEGHKKGAETIEKLVDWAMEKKEIGECSIYALSEENFKRSERELSNLYEIYYIKLQKLLKSKELHENKVKVNVVSTREDKIPSNIIEVCRQLKTETKYYGNKVLNILIGYTGQSEILRSVSSPMNRIKNLFFGLTEKDVIRHLGVQSSCDLIIRTGEEEAEREAKSGFLLWQSAYSEYYHIKKYWPDVVESDLEEAWNHFLKMRKMKGF